MNYDNENNGSFSDKEQLLNTGQKLKIGTVLKQIISVYRAGWRQFLVLSLLTIISLLGMAATEVIVFYSLPAAIILFLLSLASLYYLFRANAGIILLTRDLFEGRKRTVKESYHQTKGLAGTYFAVSLLYGLILILPAIGIGISYELIHNTVIKYGVIALLAIPLVFLAARYSMAIPEAILLGTNREFKNSKLLVKGNFWQVLTVLIVAEGVIILLSQGLVQVSESNFGLGTAILLVVIQMVFQVLTAPIYGIAPTILYLNLDERKQRIGLPSLNDEKLDGMEGEQK